IFGVASATSCHTKMNWFATLTGRLGVAVDHALLFAKAGVAWANFDRDVVVGIPATSVTASASLSDTQTGFVLGTGIEYAFKGNWSAKVEYDYMDFGTVSQKFSFHGPLFDPFTANIFADDRERVHIVRIGLNYRFGDN